MYGSGTIIITTLHMCKLSYSEVKQLSQVTQLKTDHLHPGGLYCMDPPDMLLQGSVEDQDSPVLAPVPEVAHRPVLLWDMAAITQQSP